MIAAEFCEPRLVSKLVAKGDLKRSRLEQFRLEAEMLGVPLTDILISNDLLSDIDVARSLAEMTGLRFLDLSRRRPSTAWGLVLPENVARRKNCIIFGEVSGQLVVAVADPIDPAVKAALSSRFNRPIQFVVSPAFQIKEEHDRLYGEARAKGARMVDNIPISEATARVTGVDLNIIEQLDSIIDEAVDRRASDIHIEPMPDRLRIRLRIDGRMIESRAYPLETLKEMVSRVKILATLDITEHRRGQDGRFSHRSFDQELDVRVAVIPGVLGERVTLRLLSQDRSHLTLQNLGMGIEIRQAFERLIKRPHGIILITGPTGSGKSTTLYAGLKLINSIDKHIITVEDPVEYRIEGVNQIQVDHEFGVTFASALRNIVRHDPDVIMVGEIRDEETAHLALESSLTGHLVFATLHTNSAVGAVTRLLDMGCEPYLVASGLIGVMAQRLIRKICGQCKQGFEPNDTERMILRVSPKITGVQVFRGAGCARCLRSGYYDRVGVFELVPFDDTISELVMRKVSTEELHKQAVAAGAITLREDGIRKVRDGLTTIEEILRVTADQATDAMI